MGLINRLMGKPAKLADVEYPQDLKIAMIVPMVVMMWADKKKDPAETASIHSICKLSPIFNASKPKPEHIEEWITEAYRFVREVCPNEKEACLRAKAVMGPALYATAYTFAMHILFADGRELGTEKTKANQLAEWFEVKRKVVAQIDAFYEILRKKQPAE